MLNATCDTLVALPVRQVYQRPTTRDDAPTAALVLRKPFKVVDLEAALSTALGPRHHRATESS